MTHTLENEKPQTELAGRIFRANHDSSRIMLVIEGDENDCPDGCESQWPYAGVIIPTGIIEYGWMSYQDMVNVLKRAWHSISEDILYQAPPQGHVPSIDIEFEHDDDTHVHVFPNEATVGCQHFPAASI